MINGKLPPKAPLEYARVILYEKFGWDYWQVLRTPNSEIEIALIKIEVDQLKREWEEETEDVKNKTQAALKSIQ